MWKVVEGNHMRDRETGWKYFVAFQANANSNRDEGKGNLKAIWEENQ